SRLVYSLFFGSGVLVGITLCYFIGDKYCAGAISTFRVGNSSSAAANATAPPPHPRRHRVGLKEYLRPPEVFHDMTEEELMWRASMRAGIGTYPFDRRPKVAFMFLAKKGLPLAPLWELFFRGNEGSFSIYVHSPPPSSSLPEWHAPPESVFHGRTIPSKAVEWGRYSMVEAERRLLANALLDLSNQRFVLLSESCIPIYNFTTVYEYLVGSAESFVESYDEDGPVGRGRYNRRMRPHVTVEQWRKGAQWFEMDRGLAVEVVADRLYCNLFRRFCRPSCYSDEHYLPTFVTAKFARNNSNRTLTWVDWSRGGPHPLRFLRSDVSPELVKRLRTGSRCVYNGRSTNVCHLFARKFTLGALDRLLRFAPSLMYF
ncbi:hypothetical protein M569_12413, partial [Genlisea aurea]